MSLGRFVVAIVLAVTSTTAQIITIMRPSVVTFSNYNPPLAINHQPFRESVIPIGTRAVFSVNLRPGKYLVTDGSRLAPDYVTRIQWSIDETDGQFTHGLSQDHVIHDNSVKQLDGLVFSVTTPRVYRVVGSAGAWIPNIPVDSYAPKITYELDGEILQEDYGSASVVATRLLSPGVHRFNSWITGVAGRSWCVCPSVRYGWETTHWLGVWPYYPTEQLQPIPNHLTEATTIAGKYRISDANDTHASEKRLPELPLPPSVVDKLLEIML